MVTTDRPNPEAMHRDPIHAPARRDGRRRHDPEVAEAGGREIGRDEPLFEISTDKVDTEVPSPVAGTLTKILVQEGETVSVGTNSPRSTRATAPPAPATPAAAAESRPRRTSRGGTRAPPRSRPRSSQARGPAAQAPAAGRGAAARRCRTGGRGRRSCPRSCAGWPRSTPRPVADRGDTGTGGAITKKDVMAPSSGGAAAAGRPRARTRPGRPAGRVRRGVDPRSPPRPNGAARRSSAHPHPQGDRQAHGRLPPDHRPRLEHGRGQHGARRAARGSGPRTRSRPRGFSLPTCRSSRAPSCDALLAFPKVNAELRGEEVVRSARQHGHRGLVRRGPDRPGREGRRRDERRRAGPGDQRHRDAGPFAAS